MSLNGRDVARQANEGIPFPSPWLIVVIVLALILVVASSIPATRDFGTSMQDRLFLPPLGQIVEPRVVKDFSEPRSFIERETPQGLKETINSDQLILLTGKQIGINETLLPTLTIDPAQAIVVILPPTETFTYTGLIVPGSGLHSIARYFRVLRPSAAQDERIAKELAYANWPCTCRTASFVVIQNRKVLVKQTLLAG